MVESNDIPSFITRLRDIFKEAKNQNDEKNSRVIKMKIKKYG